MIRIESTNPATSSRVSGVAFAPHPNPERPTKVSAPVDEDVAGRFCSIPGYARCGALSEKEEAALDATLAKLAAVEELGPRGTAVSQAEQTVGELQRANRALMEERDGLRTRIAELERAGTPEAAQRLSADVTRLTGEVERLTTQVADRDAEIAKLKAEPPKPADGDAGKDDKSKAPKTNK